jgi:hypothetical protein
MECPFLDGLDGGLVEVLVAGGLLDLDFLHFALLVDDRGQFYDALDLVCLLLRRVDRRFLVFRPRRLDRALRLAGVGPAQAGQGVQKARVPMSTFMARSPANEVIRIPSRGRIMGSLPSDRWKRGPAGLLSL